MTTVLWNTQWSTAGQDEKQAATSQRVIDAQVCAVFERQIEKFALLQDGRGQRALILRLDTKPDAP